MVAAAVIGGAVVSAGVSGYASQSAANTQAGAANNASQSQLNEFNTINNQQAPYREAGTNALNQLEIGFGQTPSAPAQDAANFDSSAYIAAHPEVGDPSQWTPSNGAYTHYLDYGANGTIAQNPAYAFTGTAAYNQQLAASQNPQTQAGYGQFTHQFDASDLATNLSPSYNFMLQQGLGQAQNASNATGGLLSGNTQQGLNEFAQNYASTGYQQAYNNYNNNQTQIFNRLADIAGLGQTATQSTGQAGTAATQAASGYSTSAAASQAAGTVGVGNAITNGANNAMGWNYLYGGGSGSSGSNNLGNSLTGDISSAGDYGLGGV